MPPLEVGIYDAPLSLDPHFDDEFLTFSLLSNLFEPLVRVDHQLRIQPGVAVRWENPNDLTWRFELRPGVEFHDGRPLTAADVVFSIERARGHERSNLGTYLVAVDEVRAVGETTIEVTTQRPYPILLNKLSKVLIVPDGSHEEITDPVGTGPYRLEEYRSGELLAVSAFDRHWGSFGSEERLRFVTIRDSEERTRRLAAGELDFIVDLGAGDIATLETVPGTQVVTSVGLIVDYLQMRVDRPPFDDRRVRQAVHLALDRRRLAERIAQGYAQPASQLVARNVFGFAPDLESPARDLDTARRLLTEAGYPNGFEIDLEFRSSRDGEALRDQLAEAGIRVRLRPSAWDELFPRLKSRQVGFYYGAVLASTGDASDVFDSKLHTYDPEHGWGETNFNHYSNPELDELIESSGRTLDMRSRRATLERCMRLAMEDLALLPLVVPFQVNGSRVGVEWRARVDGRVLAVDLGRVELP